MSPSRTPPGPDRGRAAEPDRPGRSEPDGGLGAGALDALAATGVPASVVEDLLERWRRADAAVGPRLAGFPDDAAVAVLVAVLAVVAAHAEGGPPGRQAVAPRDPTLRAAGERWASAHRSVSELVDRLSLLRVLLADLGLAERRVVDRAVDEVTAAAGAGLVAQLEHLSRTDPLTGVGNRRAFDEAVQRALATAARQGHQVTMVVVDLDGLKRINDRRGHAAGDAAIGSLVQAFAAALRGTDTMYRVGGDEFVVLLPYSAADQVEQLMSRVAEAGAPAFTWGAASFPGDVADAGLLFDRADRALYDRRTARRAGGPLAAVRRPLGLPDGLGQVVPIRRWAWVPAAAAVAGAVVLGLVLAGGGHPQPTTSALPPAARPGRPPVTRPAGGSSGRPSSPGGSALGRAGGRAGVAAGSPATPAGPSVGGRGGPASGGSPAEVVSISRPTGPSTGPSAGSGSGVGRPGSPAPGGATSPGPGGTGPVPSASAGSGPVGNLVAGVGQAVSGIPVVNALITPGPNGSTSVLGLVNLSGGQSGPATPGTSTTAASSVPVTSAPAASATAPSLGGALAALLGGATAPAS